ncbi:MAG: hypothetical protein GKR89_04935 [Candidatus Latescibacteria bacterium]|nr:hypothetical protein [Candidatus Latescibacterota bacterium]
MERIFANLFRISVRKGSLSHTYFLKRKKGNILISHHSMPSPEDLAEIEAMGGIESQWVCHSHDLLRKPSREDLHGPSHEDLHARFGCTLHYHEVERPLVQKKTKCPNTVFEGERTKRGTDFEALYLPTCTVGHSIYRWRTRGKYCLFTSHAMYYRDGEWDLKFDLKHADSWQPQLQGLADLQVDYVFPGYTSVKGPAFYPLDEKAKVSLSDALKAKAKDAA